MKVVISGYGRMGHLVEDVLKRQGAEIICASEDICSVPDSEAEDTVCIDFTTPAAFRANYVEIARKFKAAVVGTTGWYDIKEDVFSAFKSNGTALVWASNFSIGVNALFASVEKACSILKAHGYKADVEETHHIHKLDAPSGTAKTIAGIIESELGEEVKITSKRIGEVPGIHTAEFVSKADKLVFTHEAFSREGFAEGAVAAAFVADKMIGGGVYEFKDLIL